MRVWIVLAAVAAFTVASAADAGAQGKKKAKKSATPACLNALVCGPQPVPKMRKPKSERFMKSAS